MHPTAAGHNRAVYVLRIRPVYRTRDRARHGVHTHDNGLTLQVAQNDTGCTLTTVTERDYILRGTVRLRPSLVILLRHHDAYNIALRRILAAPSKLHRLQVWYFREVCHRIARSTASPT